MQTYYSLAKLIRANIGGKLNPSTARVGWPRVPTPVSNSIFTNNTSINVDDSF